MRKFLIFAGAAVAVIVVLGWAVLFFMKKHTKSFSPEEEVVFEQDGLKIEVFYNRPYKKGRVIFGGLVPYNQVWRTGANEATTFESNQPLTINGKTLPPGKYSLWTIPKEESWAIIFNSEYGQWGVNSKGEPNRDEARDVLIVEVRAVQQEKEFEQFTIAFESLGEDAEMVFIWDKTLVAVPFSF